MTYSVQINHYLGMSVELQCWVSIPHLTQCNITGDPVLVGYQRCTVHLDQEC